MDEYKIIRSSFVVIAALSLCLLLFTKELDNRTIQLETSREKYGELTDHFIELSNSYKQLQQKHQELSDTIEDLQEQLIKDVKTEAQKVPMEKPSRGEKSNWMKFTATAYDNTPASQGKWIDQTATGFKLKGHTLESARCIAVDPKVIPLNSKVEIQFPEPYTHLDGIYYARDTGGAIKGTIIDLFFGDGVDRKDVFAFGRRQIKLRILK